MDFSNIERYILEVRSAMEGLDTLTIQRVIEVIYNAYLNDQQVFIMGNGGSASTASHFACDLGKGTIVEGKKRFRVMSLNDNMALITAFSNDYGYEHVFSEQLKNLVQRNDVIIAISATGNSMNVLRAVEYAKDRQAYVIAFLGFNGGKLKKMANEYIHVENYNYGQVEDIHMLLSHMISQCLKEYIEKDSGNMGAK
ncbi:MAG: SIS domain-containing protein [Clostridia bacterium]|nr:SIS domain-containing protein [Clostridia bacterium]